MRHHEIMTATGTFPRRQQWSDAIVLGRGGVLHAATLVGLSLAAVVLATAGMGAFGLRDVG